jgi:Golgi phosphoprotein 3
LALPDRLIEVIDDRQTGETILDEALKMMKSSEKYGTGAWIDLMSGEWMSKCPWSCWRDANS